MHVAVIGRGILGASIAYHLALKDVNVTVIDVHNNNSNATSNNFGCLNVYNYEPDHYFFLRQSGIEYQVRLASEINAIDFVHQVGTLRWAQGAGTHARLVEGICRLEKHGVPFELFEPGDVAKYLEPGLNPGRVVGPVVRVPLEGWSDGSRFSRCLLDAGGSHIANVSAEVLRYATTRRGVSIDLKSATIQADKLILAAGIGIPALMQHHGVKIPVNAEPGVMFISTSAAQGPLSHVIYAESLHFRSHSPTQVIGGHHGAFVPNGYNAEQEAALTAQLVFELYPSIKAGTAEPVLGIRPVPEDGFPVLGWLDERRRTYVATTHSGITLGALLGRLCASEILGAEDELLKHYRPSRFNKV